MNWMTLSRRPPKLWIRIAVSVLAVAGIGIAAMVGLTWFALEGFASCRNVILSSTRSPDGTKAVLVFRQECNATVPDSTYASIAAMDRTFSADRSQAFLGFAGHAEILPSWRGSNVVEIAMMPGIERGFIRHDEKAGSIRIEYK